MEHTGPGVVLENDQILEISSTFSTGISGGIIFPGGGKMTHLGEKVVSVPPENLTPGCLWQFILFLAVHKWKMGQG